MSCWGKSQEVCATCRYWSGRREMDFTSSHFTAHEDQGMCNGPFGSFCGVITGEDGSCPKWETLKE